MGFNFGGFMVQQGAMRSARRRRMRAMGLPVGGVSDEDAQQASDDVGKALLLGVAIPIGAFLLIIAAICFARFCLEIGQ